MGRLSSWKANSLSLASRLTLCKSIVGALPSYAIQFVYFPTQVCENINKVERNFLWGSTMKIRKFSLVCWENMCRPKECGGLGLHDASLVNKAFMAKLRWRLIHEKDSLRVQVFISKYKWGVDLLPIVKERPRQSNLWKDISSN